jgi:hypothetical protein
VPKWILGCLVLTAPCSLFTLVQVLRSLFSLPWSQFRCQLLSPEDQVRFPALDKSLLGVSTCCPARFLLVPNRCAGLLRLWGHQERVLGPSPVLPPDFAAQGRPLFSPRAERSARSLLILVYTRVISLGFVASYALGFSCFVSWRLLRASRSSFDFFDWRFTFEVGFFSQSCGQILNEKEK